MISKTGMLRPSTSRDQLLGDHSLKDHGKLEGDLMLLGWLKHVHDAFDGVGCSQSMQAGKDKMTGFRSGHGSLDGFMITHLSKKDYIRLWRSVARREVR